MVISHKYKFIFIKTSKTAGTSVEVFLSEKCGKEDVFTPIFPKEDGHVERNYKGIFNPIPEIVYEIRRKKIKNILFTLNDFLKRNRFYNHIPAYKIKCRVNKDVWNKYYKFCIERNPWDKTISHFYMLKYRKGEQFSFDEYINEGYLCENYYKYIDPLSGVQLVDNIIKYENLNNELNEMFTKLGIEFKMLSFKAKSNYRNKTISIEDFYSFINKEYINLLREKYNKEFVHNNYDKDKI